MTTRQTLRDQFKNKNKISKIKIYIKKIKFNIQKNKNKNKIQLYVVYRGHSLESKICKLPCVCVCVCVQSLNCIQLFGAPWTVPARIPVHGIFQMRILEQVAISYCRGSFRPRGPT